MIIKFNIIIFIAESVEAYFDTWVVGGNFVQETMDSLHALLRTAMLKKSYVDIPYLLRQYNVRSFHAGSSDVGINRFINPLVSALNEHNRLPKNLIIIPDKDFLQALKSCKNYRAARFIGASIHSLIKEINKLFQRRIQDLRLKKPGGMLMKEEKPKII